jgi:hypothetical protein
MQQVGGGPKVASFSDANDRHHATVVIRKKSFDLPGLSRSTAPTLEAFFGYAQDQAVAAKCVPLVSAWAAEPANRAFVMGTIDGANDPILQYQLAQVVAFLMRDLQPWFERMLRTHLPRAMPIAARIANADSQFTHPQAAAAEHAGAVTTPASGRSGGLVYAYVQGRGEVAKYREYYSAIGCHNARPVAFALELARSFCPAVVPPASTRVDLRSNNTACVLYVSGNTPQADFQTLRNDPNVVAHADAVESTWLVSLAPAARASEPESARWGASSPAASWVDLFAGVHATAWACVVQSNWCRVIHFLRATVGARAHCPFVDLGAALLADQELRAAACDVRPEWPTKPFGGAKQGYLWK